MQTSKENSPLSIMTSGKETLFNFKDKVIGYYLTFFKKMEVIEMLKKTKITAILFITLLFITVGSVVASESVRNGLTVEELSKETGIELDYLEGIYDSNELYDLLSTTSGTVSPQRSDGLKSTINSKTPLYSFTLSVTRVNWSSSKHNAVVQARSVNSTIDEIEARSRIYFDGKLSKSKTDNQKNSSYAAATTTAGCKAGIIGSGKASVYGNHFFKLKGYPNVSKELKDSFSCGYL